MKRIDWFSRLCGIVLLTLWAFGSQAAFAQEDEVELSAVAGHVYMLQGQGGNIGISVGADGAFMIDDQYAPMTPKIRAAVQDITDRPVRFLINTHWHQDHTGGNENFGKAGAVIVAHDNVRKRLSTDQFIAAFDRTVPASPPAALPIITFSEDVTFHLNGDDIHAFHVPRGHTDGDTVIHFRQANVIHTGDIFFNGRYPFIDVSSGGSVDGVLAAVDRILSLADTRTKIIPGHGPLADKAALTDYRDMLEAVRNRIKALVDKGASLETVQATQPTARFDEKWGGGFLKPEQFVGIVYDSLNKN